MTCPIHGTSCVFYVPPDGPVGAPLVIIGEGPGEQELKVGKPFVGPSGIQLDLALKQVGLDRNDVLTYNAVPCAGGPSPSTPTDQIAKKWRPHLHEFIRQHRPAVIVAAGAWALYSLTGKKGIKANHGAEWRLNIEEGYEPWLLPMLHPAYCLRTYDFSPLTAVLANAKRLLDGAEAPDWLPGYVLVDDDFLLMEAVNDLSAAPALAFDVETTGSAYANAFDGVVMLGLGEPGKKPYVFPLNHPQADSKMVPLIVAAIREIFRRNKGELFGHGSKYDTQRLKLAGLMDMSKNMTMDTLYMAHLLDESLADRGKLKLKELGQSLFGIRPYDRRQVDVVDMLPSGKTKNVKLLVKDLLRTDRALEIPMDMLADYNARDVFLTCMVYEDRLKKISEDPQLLQLLRDLIMPASLAMERMERVGLPVDQAKITELESSYAKDLEAVRVQLDAFVPGGSVVEATDGKTGASKVNWASTKQVGKILYEVLQLPVVRMTDLGAPSTDDDALALLEGSHPIIPVLRNERRIKKASQTVQTLKEAVSADGRIHATFVLAGPSTGRTSSRDPNMQNLPRGAGIRDIIRAADGKTLVEIDLSLIEMRWGAYIYKEPTMTRLLREGRDLHTYTASMAFGCATEEVTSDMRQLGKTANFLMLYGGGPKKLALELRSKGFSNNQAMQALKAMAFLGDAPDPLHYVALNMHKAFHRAYPAIGEAHARIRNQVMRDKKVKSVFGRTRGIPEIDAIDRDERGGAARAASNTLVQGPASDTNLLGLVGVSNTIDRYDAEIIDTVHDSILVEAPNEHVASFIREAIGIVTSPPLKAFGIKDFNIPIEAEAKVGQSWGSMEKMTTVAEVPVGGAVVSVPEPAASAIARAETTAAPVPKIEMYNEVITSVYAAAAMYAARGWSFIPLNSPKTGSGNDASVGKRPLTGLKWEEYQTRRPTGREFNDWFASRGGHAGEPPYNIAIITGKISKLVVIDIDVKKGGEAWLKESALDSAVKVRTGGGGLHLYFHYDGEELGNSASKLAPGVDVRAEGGYVVAPPSMHISGGKYKWISDDNLLPLDVTPLPSWLIDLIKKPRESEVKVEPKTGTRVIPEEKIREVVAFIQDHYSDGKRHYINLALAGFLAKRGYRYEDVEKIISALVSESGDTEEFDRMRGLRDTYTRVLEGSVVTGYRELVDLMGKESVDELQNLFGSVHASGSVRNFTAADIGTMDIRQEEWVIEGLLPKSGFAMLSGHAGSGKTTFVIQMGLQLAAGQHVFGFAPTSPSRVLYFQADNPPNMVRRLIKEMVRHVPAEAADRFVVAEVIKPVKVTDPEGYAIVEQQIAMYTPDLLIFDTIRDFHSADENNPTAVAETIDTLKKLRGGRSMAIMYIHHHSKSTGFERLAIERHMGSIRFVTPVDLAMSLTVPLEDASKVRLAFTKVRWSRRPQSRFFRRSDEAWFEDEGVAIERTGGSV